MPTKMAERNIMKLEHINQTLKLRPGFGFRGKKDYTIKLDSNPNAGWSWSWRERCCPSIVDSKNRYVQHPGDCGTGGTEIWTFTAKAVGEETVQLAYAPESTPNDIERLIMIHFTVK
jgi:predicted secreted protein